MNLLTGLVERRYLTLSDLDRYMDQAITGAPTYSGRNITPEQSLTSSAVWRCVQLLADTTGALPLVTYRRLPGGGKDRASGLPIYRILHDAPNPEMTAVDLRSALVGHLYLWGNAYCEIQRDGYLGSVQALWPLRPDRMKLERNAGELAYAYRLPDGTDRPFAAANIWHIRLLSPNGIIGYSPISLARQGIALSMATEEYGARWFGNGARPSGVLTHPGKLGKEGRQNLRASWDEVHKGLENSQRIAVLEEGVSWVSIGIPPEDSQFLATREFQVGDTARWFGVPPHLVGDMAKSTSWGSGLEEQNLAFYTLTLLPLLKRIEQSAQQRLFSESERQTYFCEHLVDGLLRMDGLKRAQKLQLERQNGVRSGDEWREVENLNPLPEGKGADYWIPANMLVVGEPRPAAPGSTPAEEPKAPPPEPEREARHTGAHVGHKGAHAGGGPKLDATAKAHWDAMPEGFRSAATAAGLKEVKFVDKAEMAKAAGHSAKAGYSVVGLYASDGADKGTLYMLKGRDAERRTFVHELAHVVDKAGPDGKFGQSESPEFLKAGGWKATKKGDYKLRETILNRPVSDYGRTAPWEDFAETFAQVATGSKFDHRVMQGESEDRYAYVSKLATQYGFKMPT